MYYYGARTDKSGNRLLTSYSNAKMRDKYCVGESLKKHEGLFVLDTEAQLLGPVEPGFQFDENTNILVRSRMTNKNPKGFEGKFRIMALKDGTWIDTQFRGDQYGDMNTLMKALSPSYEDLIVVEDAVNMTVDSAAGNEYEY